MKIHASYKPTPRCAGCKKFGKKAKKFVLSNFLVLGLVTFVIGGGLLPQPGTFFAKLDVSGQNPPFLICVFVIFLISGLKLSTEEIKTGISAWKSFIYGVLVILAVTPFLTFFILMWPFPENFNFLLGLAVFCNAPTTLTSGVILTKAAGGNIALALLLTVTTNLLSVFTIPFILPITLKRASVGDVTGIHLDSVGLLIQLLSIILFPLAVGKLLRERSHHVRVFAKRYSLALKITSAMSLILIPWMKVSESREQIAAVSAVDLLYVVLAGAIVHAIFFIFNFFIIYFLPTLELPEKIAVIICSSEKTLPVSLAIMGVFPDQFDHGLMSISMISAHIIQIVMDGFAANYWSKKTDRLDSDLQSLLNNTDGEKVSRLSSVVDDIPVPNARDHLINGHGSIQHLSEGNG